ncbi:MAG: hypothetical protein ACKOHN_11585 [Actinomycetota bacterium]
MGTPGCGRGEVVVGGRAAGRAGEGQADCSFLAAAATKATRAMSMMRRFMA